MPTSEDTLYRLVKLEDVEDIFEHDILGGQIAERLLYVEPLTGEKQARQDDINFYKKQRREVRYIGTRTPVTGKMVAVSLTALRMQIKNR